MEFVYTNFLIEIQCSYTRFTPNSTFFVFVSVCTIHYGMESCNEILQINEGKLLTFFNFTLFSLMLSRDAKGMNFFVATFTLICLPITCAFTALIDASIAGEVEGTFSLSLEYLLFSK